MSFCCSLMHSSISSYIYSHLQNCIKHYGGFNVLSRLNQLQMFLNVVNSVHIRVQKLDQQLSVLMTLHCLKVSVH